MSNLTLEKFSSPKSKEEDKMHLCPKDWLIIEPQKVDLKPAHS